MDGWQRKTKIVHKLSFTYLIPLSYSLFFLTFFLSCHFFFYVLRTRFLITGNLPITPTDVNIIKIPTLNRDLE